MFVNFSIEGRNTTDRGFLRLVDGISDFRPLWADINTIFEEVERELFASEGASGASGRWQPLSAAYGEWKRLRFPGSSIMVLTGRLRDSLIGRSADAVIIEEPGEFARGTSVPYAKYHHEGRGRAARRRLIDLTERDKRRMGDALTRFSRDKAKRSGFETT